MGFMHRNLGMIVFYTNEHALNLMNERVIQVHHNRLARVLTGAEIRTHVEDLLSSLKWIKLNER